MADTLDEALVKLPVRVADTSAKLCSQRCGRSSLDKYENERSVMVFQLKSPAFGNAEPIPRKYTADGETLSPNMKVADLWKGAEKHKIGEAELVGTYAR